MEIPLHSRIQVFIGSIEKDQYHLVRLQKHLSVLESAGIVVFWSYERISAGTDKVVAVQRAISIAELVVLLVSVDLLSSPDFYRDWPLLEDRAAKGIKIIPVFVEHCDITITPLSRFQAINRPDTPVSSMSDAEQEKTWQQVALFIRSYAQAAGASDVAKRPHVFHTSIEMQSITGNIVMQEDTEDLSLVASAREELVKALMVAFPCLADLEMLVSFKLNENFEAIAGQQNLEQSTFRVVDWAKKTGNMRALVRGASERNPRNASLSAFVRRYM